MSINVNVQIKDGKLTITVGGQSPSSSKDPDSSKNLGQIVSEANVDAAPKDGGSAPQDPGPGGRAPQGQPKSAQVVGPTASSTLVIGPIVVDGSLLQGASAGTGGSAPDDPGPGGGQPAGSGVLVVGPIVIGGSASGGSATSSNPPAKPVTVPVPQGQ